ncbi:hypothetical protein COO60DRAFT_1529028, partial [Scenedesmus sp. NREL 46B-D3]
KYMWPRLPASVGCMCCVTWYVVQIAVAAGHGTYQPWSQQLCRLCNVAVAWVTACPGCAPWCCKPVHGIGLCSDRDAPCVTDHSFCSASSTACIDNLTIGRDIGYACLWKGLSFALLCSMAVLQCCSVLFCGAVPLYAVGCCGVHHVYQHMMQQDVHAPCLVLHIAAIPSAVQLVVVPTE